MPHETVENILQAARGVLLKHGHAGFTTRRVAEAAAISPGNLSYHFPTKRQLLQALITKLVAEYTVQFQVLLSNTEIAAGQELPHLLQLLLWDALPEEGVRTFRELWAMSLHDPVIGDVTDGLYDNLVDLVSDLLQHSHPNADVNAVRELVQFMASIAEGSIVRYGTRRQRVLSFDRINELANSPLAHIPPNLNGSLGKGQDSL